MSGKHTPGPWRAALDGDPYGLADERKLEVCCLPNSTFSAINVFAPAGGVDWDSTHTEPGWEEHLANARLIAAAPRMFAFIQQIADGYRNKPVGSVEREVGSVADAILAEAKGESSKELSDSREAR